MSCQNKNDLLSWALHSISYMDIQYNSIDFLSLIPIWGMRPLASRVLAGCYFKVSSKDTSSAQTTFFIWRLSIILEAHTVNPLLGWPCQGRHSFRVSLWCLPTECKITAGHWPISNHFSKMANQNFSMVHSLCTHGQSNSQKWPSISNFLFCTLFLYCGTKVQTDPAAVSHDYLWMYL